MDSDQRPGLTFQILEKKKKYWLIIKESMEMQYKKGASGKVRMWN